MPSVLLPGAVSFAVTFLVLPAIIRVASEKKLFDVPDARKVHTSAIASLGGVGLFIGFFLSFLLTNEHAGNFQFLFAAAMVIFFLGLKDDILIISAKKKFIGQVVAAAILIHLGNIRIDSMHGFMGIYSLPEVVSYLISYATIIVVVNAFNLIDGVDGLAGSLGALTTALFGLYFLYAQMPEFSMIAFCMTGALLAFLWFNFSPAKIFMGDSGSLLLGMINAILVIRFITVADASVSQFPLTASVALGFSVLFLPLFDTLRVFTIRLAKGRSPFAPDRNHIHHLLLDLGLNHRQVSLACLGINIGFIALAYLSRNFGSTVVISLMLVLAASLSGWLFWTARPRAKKIILSGSYQHSPEAIATPAPTKIVTMANEAAVADHS